MTMKEIENPTVDDVRIGDAVTIEQGDSGEPGYFLAVKEVGHGQDYGRGQWVTRPQLSDLMKEGYRLVSIRREVPDLPTQTGALVICNGRVAVRGNNDEFPWSFGNGWDQADHVIAKYNPEELVPIPRAAWEAWMLAARAFCDTDDRGLIDATKKLWTELGLSYD